MLTVHGDNRSGNCLTVKWLLDRPGRDYRRVETDVMSGANRGPPFPARKPAGRVPAVALVAYTGVARVGDFDLAACPAIRAWIARVEAAFGIWNPSPIGRGFR